MSGVLTARTPLTTIFVSLHHSLLSSSRVSFGYHYCLVQSSGQQCTDLRRRLTRSVAGAAGGSKRVFSGQISWKSTPFPCPPHTFLIACVPQELLLLPGACRCAARSARTGRWLPLACRAVPSRVAAPLEIHLLFESGPLGHDECPQKQAAYSTPLRSALSAASP